MNIPVLSRVFLELKYFPEIHIQSQKSTHTNKNKKGALDTMMKKIIVAFLLSPQLFAAASLRGGYSPQVHQGMSVERVLESDLDDLDLSNIGTEGVSDEQIEQMKVKMTKSLHWQTAQFNFYDDIAGKYFKRLMEAAKESQKRSVQLPNTRSP